MFRASARHFSSHLCILNVQFLSKAALLDSVVSQVDADAVFDVRPVQPFCFALTPVISPQRYKTGNTLLFEQFPSVIADLASLKFPDAKPVVRYAALPPLSRSLSRSLRRRVANVC